MYIVIRQANGQSVEGVLLAASRHSLRVMLPGTPDATELRREYGAWSTESGEPVELESLVSDPTVDLSQFSEQLFPLTRTVGAETRHC